MKKSKSLLRPKPRDPSFSNLSLTPQYQLYKTIKSSCYKPPKSVQKLYQRLKQNQLNTKFNERKNKLKVIYEDNRQIYKKIMTRKSDYNKDQLNKSTSSLNSSMRSRSKSRCSSFFERQRLVASRRSNTSKSKSILGYATLKPKVDKPKVNIVKISVNNIQNDKILELRNIFSRTSKIVSGKQNLPSLSHRQFTERFDLAPIKQKPMEQMPRHILRSTTNSRIKVGVQSYKNIDNNMYLF